jgi:NADPH:quinone reductase-like Zn-dependent oxidoreductase
MPKIVQFHEFGDADVLKLEDQPLKEPGEGEVRLKVEAISLNRAEVGFRAGRYIERPAINAVRATIH